MKANQIGLSSDQTQDSAALASLPRAAHKPAGHARGPRVPGRGLPAWTRPSRSPTESLMLRNHSFSYCVLSSYFITCWENAFSQNPHSVGTPDQSAPGGLARGPEPAGVWSAARNPPFPRSDAFSLKLSPARPSGRARGLLALGSQALGAKAASRTRPRSAPPPGPGQPLRNSCAWPRGGPAADRHCGNAARQLVKPRIWNDLQELARRVLLLLRRYWKHNRFLV